VSFLQKLGLGRGRGPCRPVDLEVAAIAIQLDACFALLHSSRPPESEYPDFFALLLNTVAGPRAPDVWQRLSHYCEIRRDADAEDRNVATALWGGTFLHRAWSGERQAPDPLLYVPAVLELTRQGVYAAQECLSRWPARQDWPSLCAAIAAFLEQGRTLVGLHLASLPALR